LRRVHAFPTRLSSDFAEPRTNAAPVQYAQGRFEASYGTYGIDAGAHTFAFHVEGALVRTLPGKELTRVFAFSGKQLIVKSANPNEHWRVAWELTKPPPQIIARITPWIE